MELETYIKRGREIVDEVEILAKRKPLPADELEALSEEWRASLPEILRLAQEKTIDERMNISNYFIDVNAVIDMPFRRPPKKRRKK